MIEETLKDINKSIKKYYKYIATIIIYIMYMLNISFLILMKFGININDLNRTFRIFLIAFNGLIYILILTFMFRKEIKNGFEDLKENIIERLNLATMCWIVGSIIMIASSIFISKIIGKDVSNNEEIIRQNIKLAPLYMLFSCSIVAPIMEEFVFRRAIRGFIKYKWLYVLISGLSFGLLHVIGNNTNMLDYLYIIPYSSMGCAFAYLYSKTENISLPILVHMTHNTILVIVQIIGGLL